MSSQLCTLVKSVKIAQFMQCLQHKMISINRVVMKCNAANHQTNYDLEISSWWRHLPEPLLTSVFGLKLGSGNMLILNIRAKQGLKWILNESE